MIIDVQWGKKENISILGKTDIECVVYMISKAVSVYNYPSAPDSVDEMEIGQEDNVYNAVSHVLKVYTENNIAQVLRGINESEKIEH